MRSFIIAHRGASFHAPENTLSAFHAAAELGADGVETDVQLTGDGELVVHHNYAIDGCSNGSGMIAAMSLSELKTYDFGSYHGGEWISEQILTLDEFLDAAKDFALTDVELKAPLDSSAPFVRRVTNAVLAHGMRERVVISAFDHNLLREVKRCCKEMRVGVLTMPTDFTQNRLFSLLRSYLPAERKLIEVAREDLRDMPDDTSIASSVGIRSADMTGAIVELARQIGAVYPRYTIREAAAALDAQSDLVGYLAALDFKADFLHCHFSSVLREPALLERLARMGVGCNPWTPDEPDDLARLNEMGCTAIITNRPDLLLQIQRQKREE